MTVQQASDTVVSVKQIGDYTVVTYKVSIEGKFNKQTTEKIFKCYYLTSSYKILTSKYKEPLSSQNSPWRKFLMAEVIIDESANTLVKCRWKMSDMVDAFVKDTSS